MEDLASVQAELESREETLIKQGNLYIVSKEALALERSEVKSLARLWPKSKRLMLSQGKQILPSSKSIVT
jgi:hypothetical protein